MVEFNFNQLHEYLVTRTNKYDDPSMKGSCYKKLKSYQFFMEGHVSNVEVARGQGHTWIKSKGIASIKKTKYNVMVVFHSNGDVRYAACGCPAGLCMNEHGKCNHIGGVLFAVNSFYANGLHSNTAKVSCTSKLNGWIVPRNLTVPPKPVKEIKVEKIQFGSNRLSKTFNQSSVFDPRAPQHRTSDNNDLDILHTNLKEFAPFSGYLLFQVRMCILKLNRLF
ncbi:uncharacterized protein LOC110456646 [Mizuhopecten yessoensis]|uniref:uncharacterized protein LOC110456646 n=1 Tax=Mizuhopecten yessoensis TaxID=6573 RepID=UPI000B458F59|nr:uncharacterized protein LOC110456646 [Mizuhopecten yessoensis]